MNNRGDKIMFDWWYPVAMFPQHITRSHPRKIVRAIGLLLSFPWFFVFLPLTFIVVLIAFPVTIWDDL